MSEREHHKAWLANNEASHATARKAKYCSTSLADGPPMMIKTLLTCSHRVDCQTILDLMRHGMLEMQVHCSLGSYADKVSYKKIKWSHKKVECLIITNKPKLREIIHYKLIFCWLSLNTTWFPPKWTILFTELTIIPKWHVGLVFPMLGWLSFGIQLSRTNLGSSGQS